MTRMRKLISIATLVGLTSVLAGCNEFFWAGSTISGIAGLVLGTRTAVNTEYTCYRNGEPINCADLPGELFSSGN